MAKHVPRFILSYVRSERDAYLDRFYNDLRRELAFREGLDSSESNREIGFRDTDSIPGGSDWQSELAEALAVSRVCISIYTPNYFTREACGKEFQVFLDRAGVTYGKDGEAIGARGILPILWAGIGDLRRKGLPPAVAARISFRAKKYHGRYETDGLRQILRRGPRSAAYLDIVNDIVSDLIAQSSNPPSALVKPPSYSAVKNAFHRDAPRAATNDGVSAGPRCLQVFVIGPASVALPGALASECLNLLDESDAVSHVSVEAIDSALEAPTALIQRLADKTRVNTLTFVVVAPDQTPSAPLTLALRDAVLMSGDWIGGIVLARKTGSTAPVPSVPAAYRDRLVLRDAREDPQKVVDEIYGLVVEVTTRILAESTTVHPPGGIETAEKPKLSGPGQSTSP